MLQKKGHDYSVDYYCLGAILYELVIGSPPFYTTHTSEMFDRILSEEVAFPQDLDLSDEIIDLISNLLIKNPKYRRGSMGGVKEIMAHPWCKKMNIKDIEGKKIETPVKPNVFEFYVDEVSDDGELSNKMKDIYDEAFDELSEEDENERQFKNFYYESENIDVNKILKQRMPSSDSKAKHFLSNPDFSIVNQKILKQQNDEKIYQDIKELMNELHAKKNLSDNFHIQNQSTSYQSEILNDKINSINQDVNKNNGPYFIADQYRKKAPDSLTNLNAYSSYLKQQRSLEYQLSTSQKVITIIF